VSDYDSIPCDLGVSTADARDIRFEVDAAHVTVRFLDWRDVACEIVFAEPLGVRWVVEGEAKPWRDDTTCEVRGSAWLATASREHGVSAEGYAHYQLGFNEVGMVLELLVRRR
jgi:hypothetical protein